ncbi:MAG: hypothetical protein ACI8RC_001247 [Ilumatobacter sp.]|jgi:hypothetical protein
MSQNAIVYIWDEEPNTMAQQVTDRIEHVHCRGLGA